MVPISGDEVERAMTAVASGRGSSEAVEPIRSLVNRLDDEYESLVDGDESKLSCTEPAIAAAFCKYAAARTLQYALEGDLSNMAYEAWFALDDLAEIRRLAGMPPSRGKLNR